MDNIINQLYQYQRDKQNVEHSLKMGVLIFPVNTIKKT